MSAEILPVITMERSAVWVFRVFDNNMSTVGVDQLSANAVRSIGNDSCLVTVTVNSNNNCSRCRARIIMISREKVN